MSWIQVLLSETEEGITVECREVEELQEPPTKKRKVEQLSMNWIQVLLSETEEGITVECREVEELQEPPTKKRKVEQFSCEICKQQPSKYTCPQCNRRTCSLACSQQHKQTFSCQGKRDRTAFVSLPQMNNNHLMSDYQFLQDVQQSSDTIKRFRDQHHISEEVFTVHGRNEKMVQKMALQRNIWMQLLPQGMERWRKNTSYFDQKLQTFFWRLEFVFHNTVEQSSRNKAAVGKPIRIIDRKANETDSIETVLQRFYTDPKFTQLQYNLADFIKDQSSVRFLLKTEIAHLPMEQLQILHALHENKNGNGFYYQLDTKLPIKDALKEKVVVEYPVILCVLENDVHSFSLWNDAQQQQYKLFRQEDMQQRLQRKQQYLDKQKAYFGEEEEETEQQDTTKPESSTTNNVSNQDRPPEEHHKRRHYQDANHRSTSNSTTQRRDYHQSNSHHQYNRNHSQQHHHHPYRRDHHNNKPSQNILKHATEKSG